MKWSVVLGIVALACTAGCGSSGSKSSDTSSSSSSSTPASGGSTGAAAGSAAQQAAQGAQSAAQGMQQLAQSLQQLSQTQQNVQVVDSDVLKGYLPDVSGWEKSGVKGEQMSMGVSISSAEAQYKKGDSSVQVKITDTSFSQLMLAPFTMMVAAGYKEDSDDGFKRSAQIAGNPGWEEWQKGSKHAEAHAIVGNRFIVEAEANSVDNVDAAVQFVQAVNLAKLAAQK